jgi:hypothetical protein
MKASPTIGLTAMRRITVDRNRRSLSFEVAGATRRQGGARKSGGMIGVGDGR